MAETAPAHPVLTAALQAHDLGLCVIPARTDGSKAPQGYWERWQTERPTVEQIHQWFGNGHPGIGLVCGEISGNLEMLELEGVAVVVGIGFEVSRLAKEAGIGHIIERLRNGYFEHTPSKGIHWLYRVEGEPVPGNTKLAVRNATDAELAVKPTELVKTLIETRGEGGFTIIAPSHGTTHPSGKPWHLGGGNLANIPTLTADERDQLHAVCRTFNTYKPAKVTASVPAHQRTTPQAFTGHVGDSWVNATTEHLAATETWDNILGRYGWRYLRDDRHGSALWCRPGKDDGVGAWVKNDRLNVFSTSTPLDSADRTTLDRLDVIAAYEHGGDRKGAAKAIAESTGILAAWQHQRDAQSNTAATQSTPAPDADTNGETGEISDGTNLPDEFWNARPSLQHIRQAAHHRTTCADAVLLVTLARVATLLPPTVKLPAIVASPASLNFFGAIVSASGGGKSSSVDVGGELVPIDYKDIVDGVPPGSGEGLIELYLEMVDDVDPDTGKKVKVKRQTKRAAFVFVDEGQTLIAMGERSGTTVMQTLRSAWSGQLLGQQNASQETNRKLGAHRYRMGLIMGFQLQYAATIIADDEGGTPQRFVFCSATDPSVPEDPPEWPGSLPLDLPPVVHSGTTITFDDDIAAGIRKTHHAKVTGKVVGDPLDGHAALGKMKVAALLALIDNGRTHVTQDDWLLATKIMRTSNTVRSWAIEVAKSKVADEHRSRNAAAADRELTVADTLEQRALDSGAKSVARKAHRTDGIVTKNELRHAVAGKHRSAASFDDMLTLAEHRGWIKATDGGWTAGESKPS